MASASINLDGAELFNECLAQATVVVKQVLPSHYANATPNVEWDARDLVDHMLGILEIVTYELAEGSVTKVDDVLSDDSIDQEALDLSVQWQAAADRVETVISDVDLEETLLHNGKLITIEDFLIELSGDLLIHTWDLGEAIGMPVRFKSDVATAVMETTVVPNSATLQNQSLFNEPINPPANADLQTRLLALFGRSYAWRTFA